MTILEPLLSPEEQRYALFPIRYQKTYDFYKRAEASFWVAGEVDLSRDPRDWERLTAGEKHFLSHILAFFATSDGIVNENLAERFGREVCILEAKFFYDLQKAVENIHNEMYSLLIDTYIKDKAEQATLFNAIDDIPCVKKKAQWAQRWIASESATFAERLVAFAIVEGIFFSGSFCAIFWIKQRDLMPGLCMSNSFIARDEGLHQDFAVHLYVDMLQERLSDETIHALFRDAVTHEQEFVCDALPVSLVGMNAVDMATYIEYVADRLLMQLGHPPLYRSACPFDFMKLQGIQVKTNFFESRESSYQKAGVGAGADHVFATDGEF